MATDTDIAWCAGFFDGEGHVSYRRSYPSSSTGRVSPSLMASIPQASENIEVLEFFHSVVEMGRIKGPYKMPNGKPQHILLFGVDEVEKLFGILRPNLKKEKTSDFIRAIMGYYSHNPQATPEDHARKIKWQKKKGCPKCENKEWNGMMCFECGYLL